MGINKILPHGNNAFRTFLFYNNRLHDKLTKNYPTMCEPIIYTYLPSTFVELMNWIWVCIHTKYIHIMIIIGIH